MLANSCKGMTEGKTEEIKGWIEEAKKQREGIRKKNSRKSVRWSAVPVAPQVVFGSV